MKSIEDIKIGKWEINEEDKKEDLKFISESKDEDKDEVEENDSLEDQNSDIKFEMCNDNTSNIELNLKESKKIKKSNFKICTVKCRKEKELIEGVIFKNGWKVLLIRNLFNF